MMYISINPLLKSQLPQLEIDYPDPQARKNQASILSHKWWQMGKFDVDNLAAFDFPISTGLFKNSDEGRGYSNKQNVYGVLGVMVDIDKPQQVSMVDFLVELEEYNYVLILTLNHNKIKDEQPACERYRVYLMYQHPVYLDTQEVIDYDKRLKLLFKTHPILKKMDIDPTTAEPSRYFYPGSTAFHVGNSFFDYKSIPELPVEPVQSQSTHTNNPYMGAAIPPSILDLIGQMGPGNRSDLVCKIGGKCKAMQLDTLMITDIMNKCITRGADHSAIRSFKKYAGLK